VSVPPIRILILGASYGLLPGVKLSLAGHHVTLVGRADEVAAMARGPVAVHLPGRRASPAVVLTAAVANEASPGHVALTTPVNAAPDAADFVILAMQEPQYADPEVAALMADIAAARIPCLSIMNLAPPPFLARLGLSGSEARRGVYHSGPVWDGFDPLRFTLASPDPQAIRPDPAEPGHLLVTLASNFKAAPFALPDDQALLQRLAADMSHLVDSGGNRLRPPVALIASRSLFVPLAKWPMLITGNCQCVLADGSQTIAAAVLTDSVASSAIYADVTHLVIRLGAAERDLVGFDAYAKAAASLTRPASLARALDAGNLRIERVDLLIRNLMAEQGLATGLIQPIVDRIEARILRNNRLVSE